MFDTGFGQDLSARTLESDLRCLSDWQRRYLPNVHSPLGQQILAWLIRNRDQPKPFSHLLVSTSFSPTCVRHLLNQFAVLGLVEVPKAPVTCRRGNIVATPKLQETLEEYAECIKGIISHHRGIGSTSAGPGAATSLLTNSRTSGPPAFANVMVRDMEFSFDE
jgi:hypothetical protein